MKREELNGLLPNPDNIGLVAIATATPTPMALY